MSLRPRRAHFGFFGLIVCVLLLYAVILLIDPWAIHMGGRWTPLLYWAGTGKLVTMTGTYPLYVMIYPATSHATLKLDGLRPTGDLHGTGWLCTSREAGVPLDLTGTIYGDRRSTDGSLMQVRLLEQNGPRQQLLGSGSRRGYFDLFGYWHGPELVMNDRGAWSSPFRSGLRIEHASVSLQWTGAWNFKAACARQ